jgi:hypothetical protein
MQEADIDLQEFNVIPFCIVVVTIRPTIPLPEKLVRLVNTSSSSVHQPRCTAYFMPARGLAPKDFTTLQVIVGRPRD